MVKRHQGWPCGMFMHEVLLLLDAYDEFTHNTILMFTFKRQKQHKYISNKKNSIIAKIKINHDI